ncbi:MAG: hypothetical protein NZ932_03205, partial [Candidatus Bathyarchaeota archaeon]|nr:hypothetical protein [Candidatus Bathyarchaeota archaeon]
MKTARLCVLLAILTASAIAAPIIYVYYFRDPDLETAHDKVFFGVTFSKGTFLEAKRLIDKVKNYTNLLVITAWDELCAQKDEKALNEVCEYAVNAKLHFIVYFSFISQVAYPWHRQWLENATKRFGEHFLGVY